MLLTYDGCCFVCGERSDEGPRMRFKPTDDGAACEFVVPTLYESWRGTVHGGVIALMLDEAVGWAGWHTGHPGLTGRLDVRYRRPLRIAERVRVVGRIERVRRRVVYARATIDEVATGDRVAEASATLLSAAVELRRPSITTTAAGRREWIGRSGRTPPPPSTC